MISTALKVLIGRLAAAMRAAMAGLSLAALTAGAAAAKPIPNVFDHKDWIGVCDNTLRCTVMGLAPEGQDRAYLSIVRDGEANAAPVLNVVIYSDQNIASGPVRLHAPGFDADIPGRWDDGMIVAQSKDAALIAAIAHLGASQARLLQVSVAKTSVPISLSGAAAALAWMDDRQDRIGEAAAMVRRGPKSHSEPLAAATPPVFASAPKGSAVEVKPANFPKALLARAEVKGCDHDELSRPDARGAWRLGPDLMLWSVPCTLGAYNLGSVFLMSDDHGGSIRPAPIPFIATPDSTEPGANPPYNLVNADFNPKTMILEAFEKARGLGDCGTLERFLWDGRAFQPLEVDYMPECRGVTPEAWPTLVRGRVK